MKRYKTILADPPWQYKDKASPKHGRCPYPTMPLKEIINLKVKEIAEEQSHLYLWVTNSFMEDGFKVLRAWGFEPKTIITWFKPNYLGLGHYWRNNTEHCLFGVRGGCKTIRKDIWNAIVAPKRNHSAKPIEFYGLVEEMSEAPRIELFCRSKRIGWDSWGNEIKSDIILIKNNP